MLYLQFMNKTDISVKCFSANLTASRAIGGVRTYLDLAVELRLLGHYLFLALFFHRAE